MANYEANYLSTGIRVKDGEAFEKVMRLLGFDSDDSGRDNLIESFTGNDGLTTYYGIGGYGSVPNYLDGCPNGGWCHHCPLKGLLDGFEDSDVCSLSAAGEGEASYDLFDIISEHLAEGASVRVIETGNEKLRYITSVTTIITPDGVTYVDNGVTWGDIDK